MAAITKEAPDFDECKDNSMAVTLSFSLMRMVNSHICAANKINSVKQALTLLGLGQLKQWIIY
jgi:EAL and modified HD-GYP domain-containing signal transduction protein